MSLLQWRDWPLAVKLTVLMTLLAVLPLTVVTFYNSQQSQKKLLDTSRAESYQRAKGTATVIEASLNGHLGDIQALAAWLALGTFRFGNADDVAVLERVLDQLREFYAYQTINILNTEGRIVVSTDSALVGLDLITDTAFRMAAAGRTYVSEVYICEWCQTPGISYAAPIRSNDGRLLGVVIGWLDFSYIDQLVALDTGFAGPQGYSMLWESHGIILSHGGDPQQRLTPLVPLAADVETRLIAEHRFGEQTEQLLKSAGHEQAIMVRSRALLYDKDSSPFLHLLESRDFKIHAVIVPLTQQRWLYGIFIPESNLLAQIETEKRNAQTAVCLGVLVASMVGLLLAQYITRPVRIVAGTAQAIAAGDLSQRSEVHRRDEIGQLSTAFDTMAETLQHQTTELQRSEEQFRRLSEAAFEAIIIHEGGVLLNANNQFFEMFGYEPEELLGKQVMPLTVAPEAIEAMRKEIATGGVGPYESMGLRKDGTKLPMEIRVREMEYKGRKVRVSAVMDITEHKRDQEALQQRSAQLEAANKELEAFSYSVSHDLRAPLRAIDGFSRIVLRDYASLLPDEGQRQLQRVRDNTQQMGRLIDDLLTFSRLSRQPLKKESVAPANLVRQVLSDLSGDQEGRQIEITIGDLPICQADPALLKQVFVNLLSNALKFTRQRDVARIEVGCSQINGETVFFVKDNGAGFDMRYADKLFGVFQRLHRAEDYEGTGVGLATVQRIVHRHSGRVWAEAEVDKGTTFYFTLEGDSPHD